MFKGIYKLRLSYENTKTKTHDLEKYGAKNREKYLDLVFSN